MNTTYRRIVITLVLFTILASKVCGQVASVTPDLYEKVDKQQMNHWVDSVFNKLTIDQKVGQLFSMIIAGNNTEGNKRRLAGLIKNQHIGGILFSKITIQDHATLTNYAQSLAEVPLMVALDGEWGLAMRIQNTTPWPRNMMLGAIQNDSLLYYYGLEVGRQCVQMGIHVNFAPALDVNSNPRNPVIGYRSFGENPQRVAELGVMYSKGLEAAGVMSVAKHFPGHGDTATDSHHTLPLISHDRERLNNFELVPFAKYINEGLSGMMIGHLNIPSLDNTGQPSSLSRNIVTNLLKDEMGFSGLVFTDGMQMQGVAKEKDHSVRALLAGNDVVLSPTFPAGEFNSVKKAVEDGTISSEMLTDKVKRVLSYKYILGVTSRSAVTVEKDDLTSRLNTSYADWLNRKLHENAITLLKDEKEIVPINKLDQRKIAAISVGASNSNRFLSMLKKYGSVDTYAVSDGSQLPALKAKLAKYNTIIVSVHNRKMSNNAGIVEITKGKESLLAFFISPYYLDMFAPSINAANGVILGYEDTELAHDFTAQAIFGGKELHGRVPVSVGTMFNEGTGIVKKKTRLGYGIPEEAGIQSSDLDSIEVIVNEGIKEKAYPGAQVLIAKDGIVIYNRSFGSFRYDDQKVENTDIFDLASMSKASATVPALMKLHDAQKLKLSEPLSRFIPALRGTNKDRLTIRDALLHETGITAFIPYYMGAIDQESYSGGLFSRRKTAVYDARFDANTYARTDYKFKSHLVSKTAKDGYIPVANGLYVSKAYTDSIVQQIADSKLRANSNYLYSCLNFMLLKEVVENLAKENISDYLQENFFTKLGASTSTYNPLEKFSKDIIVPTENDEFLRKQVLQGYVHDEGAAFMGGVSGNAGLFSNANDLAKMYQMWLNDGEYGGERYVSANTMRLFTRGKSSRSRRGLGFDKPETRGNKSGPTSPSTPASVYGHTGFTGTCFWVDPDNNMIYIFLSNRVYPKRSPNKLGSLEIRPRIQEEIYKAIKKGKAHDFRNRG